MGAIVTRIQRKFQRRDSLSQSLLQLQQWARSLAGPDPGHFGLGKQPQLIKHYPESSLLRCNLGSQLTELGQLLLIYCA